jgi:hypothetical protein
MTVAQVLGRSADCGARLGSCFRADPRLLIRAVCWRAVLPVLKRAVSLQVLVRWMWPGGVAQSPPGDTLARARLNTVRYFIAHGGRFVVSGNSLERSLLLYRFLGEVNLDPKLVMGVRREEGATDGHVWIEVEGEPLADSTTSRYVPVLVFGAGGALITHQRQCERD